MKQVQFPRGTSEQEDAILGPDGQVRVDTDRNELRLHDGVLVGGHRIPNERSVMAMVASGIEGAGGTIQLYPSEGDLMAANPSGSTLAIVTEAGKEGFFVWQTTNGDQGDVDSSVTGSWRRLDSAASEVIRLWRAGFINLLVDSVPPQSDQSKTAWIDDGEVMLWDGSAYAPATPETFCAMLAAVGGFSTESFTLPDRLQQQMVLLANADDGNVSGWFRGDQDTLNSPISAPYFILAFSMGSLSKMQIAYERNTPNRIYQRHMISGTWGVWERQQDLFETFLLSQIPNLPASRTTSGTFSAARIPGLDASKITGGIFDLARIPDIPPAKIDGTLSSSQIPNLNASKITGGIFSVSRIPDLDAGKITTGVFDIARIPAIPVGNLSGTIPESQIGNLPASKVTSGTFNAARIPSLDAGKITSGTFNAARIPGLDASKITGGVFDVARIPHMSTSSDSVRLQVNTTDPNVGSSIRLTDSLGLTLYVDNSRVFRVTTAGTLLEGSVPAARVDSGTLSTARIPNLPASQITSGTFSTSRIPNLPASKITSGVLPLKRGGTGETTQAGMRGVYTGTSTTVTALPIGSMIMNTDSQIDGVVPYAPPNRNASLTVRRPGSDRYSVISGEPMLGTWRNRGFVSSANGSGSLVDYSYSNLWQRTA